MLCWTVFCSVYVCYVQVCLQANWRTCKKFRNFKKKFPPFEGHNRRLSWEHLTITNDASAFALEF